jgi:PAS domain S-box-containing protein
VGGEGPQARGGAMSDLEHVLLQALANNVPHRIYAKDTQGRFIFANRAVAIGMGAGGPADLIGKTDFDFYCAASAAQYFQEEQEIMRSGTPMVSHEEHVRYTRSGREAWMLTTKVPYRDAMGTVLGIVGINYDLTERKNVEAALVNAKEHAERAAAVETMRLYRELIEQHGQLQQVQEALRESESLLKAAQKISRTGAWRRRPGRSDDVWSPECFDILGLDPQRDAPSFDLVVQRIHPDDLEVFKEEVRATLERREAFDFEFRIVMPDGKIRHLQSLGEPVGKHDFVGALIDLTDRKASEAALRNSQNELAHMSRLSMAGELAASIAHEIMQPLTTIVANAAASLRMLDKHELAQARDGLRDIVNAAMHGAEVIQGLGRLIRKSEPELVRLDLLEAVREVVVLTEAQAQLHGVSIDSRPVGRALFVAGNRAQLQQVLLNLIINAIEAMAGQDGPKLLRVRARRQPDGRARVCVEDGGPGIDPSVAQTLFEPFVTTKPTGMGMGLSICRTIIEAHGGRLACTPAPGGGSIFSFELPCEAAD